MSFLINPYAFLAAGGDFEPIATVTVGSGGASSIEFTSIPGTYQHLQVRMLTRGTKSGVNFGMRWLFNGLSPVADKPGHYLYGDGASVAAGSQPTYFGTLLMGSGPAATATANVFGASIFDIVDYASTSKNTTLRGSSAYDLNGSGYVIIESGAWLNTAAVSSFSIACDTGNFAQYSTAALYGVKA